MKPRTLRNHLRLYAQPMVPLNDSGRERTWYEILLRFVANARRVVSPHLFIPAAERYGQMAAIDRWVVDKVLKEHQAFGKDREVRLSINLSGTTIPSGDLSGYI